LQSWLLRPGCAELRAFELVCHAESITSNPDSPFHAVGFARALRQGEVAMWEEMVTRITGYPARVRNESQYSPTASRPTALAQGQPAVASEGTWPPSAFSPFPGIDLESISSERKNALCRSKDHNRLSMTEQVLSYTSSYPLSFIYAPVYASVNATLSPRGVDELVLRQTTSGPRVFPRTNLTPRGTLPDLVQKRFVGVLIGSTSSAKLIDVWKRLGRGIEGVEVLVSDVTPDTQSRCVEVSAKETVLSNSTSVLSYVLTCRNGTETGTVDAQAITPDVAVLPSNTSWHPITCTDTSRLFMTVASKGVVLETRDISSQTQSAGELARQQLTELCQRIQATIAVRSDSSLYYESLMGMGGRVLRIQVAASSGFEFQHGEVAEWLPYVIALLVVLLVTLAVIGITHVATESAVREDAERNEAENRLHVAKTVHHTIVSYLAHEMRGGLSVSSINASLLSEGLQTDGLVLPSGEAIAPRALFDSAPGVAEGSRGGEDVEGVTPGSIVYDLQAIQAASTSSLRLIEDILDLVGLETGKLNIKFAMCKPVSIVRSIVKRYRAMSTAGIEVRVRTAIPSRVLCDPLRLEQSFANGLSNAIKHSRQGTIHVDLSVEIMPFPLSWFRLQDKGLNFFEQAAQSHLFKDEGGEFDEEQVDGDQPLPTHKSESSSSVPGTPHPQRVGCCASPSPHEKRLPLPSLIGDSPMVDEATFEPVDPSTKLRGPVLKVQIKDNGGGLKGMDPRQLLRPFVTDDKKIRRGTTRVKSTGLGLPIAAQVTSLVGGRVTLHDDGEGHTLYTLYLPLVAPPRLAGKLGSPELTEKNLNWVRELKAGKAMAVLDAMIEEERGIMVTPSPKVSRDLDTVGVDVVEGSGSRARSTREEREARREARRKERASTSKPATPEPIDGARPRTLHEVDAESFSSEAISGLQIGRGRAGGPLAGTFALVVDDEPIVLDSTIRLLRRLGCDVASTQDPSIVPLALSYCGQAPSSVTLQSDEVSASAETPKAATVAGPSSSSPPPSPTRGVGGSRPESSVLFEARPGSRPFDFALFDIIMPACNGDVLCRKLRRQGVELPILAVTGNVAKPDIKRYEACGFTGSVGKPLSQETLLAQLTETLKVSFD
jgi:signal transduction histidine kinase